MGEWDCYLSNVLLEKSDWEMGGCCEKRVMMLRVCLVHSEGVRLGFMGGCMSMEQGKEDMTWRLGRTATIIVARLKLITILENLHSKPIEAST